ncbi:MAG: sensor histidine kinase [Propionibacteriaceae bacterium]
MRIDDLRPLTIFAGLTNEQLADLLAGATEVTIAPGVDLFREGEAADFWWVLVDGSILLSRHSGREDTVVARMDEPGRWAGGFRAWDAHGTYLATGRGADPGRVLRVPASVLRQLADAWFPFGVHLITGLYSTARSIESTARQRESLVTLGTLAAGLAHEINNPASAATRAAAALQTANDGLLSALTRLAEDDLPAAQFAALDSLRRQIAAPVTDVDPLARADREDALAAWLHRARVGHADRIARPPAAAGVDPDWCAQAASVLQESALEPALDWVAQTFSVAALLSEVRESTRRISELVGAVRSYSQMDRASLQRLPVSDGLESTLVMLNHKLGPGITVVREYSPELPQIEAYVGELNQVWTNLIDNAVDAMDGSGTLRVTACPDQNGVIVEVADTGSGIPPEVAAHAFEAFFTTKEVGRGTCLGLDIAQRIVVERHGGTITIDSRPGETVLRVRLPLRPPGR